MVLGKKLLKDLPWKTIKLLNARPNPVFLIGFPRSGTTLLDSILNSHPSLEVIEEKPMVSKLIDSLSKLPGGGLQDLEKIDENQAKKFKKIYFDCLDMQINNKKNSKIYIDKFPLNIIYSLEPSPENSMSIPLKVYGGSLLKPSSASPRE